MILKYFLAWFGMMVFAIINGGLRDFVYKSHVGDLPAHQISTVMLIVLTLSSYHAREQRSEFIVHKEKGPVKSQALQSRAGGMVIFCSLIFPSVFPSVLFSALLARSLRASYSDRGRCYGIRRTSET